MNARAMITRVMLTLVLALTLFTVNTPTARADFMNDAFNAIDTACDDHHGGDTFCEPAFNFKFGALRTLLDECTGDDVQACADMISSNPSLQDTDATYLGKVVSVYFDIKNKDYWGLTADGGELIACAAAESITGVDVCGAIKTLITAGEDIYQGAKAAADFLASLGGDVAKGIKAVACFIGLGGCDSGGPPPPSPGQLAQAYLTAEIPDGIAARESGPAVWASFYGVVRKVGVDNGLSGAEIDARMDWWLDQVYASWSADIVKNELPALSSITAQLQSQATIQAQADAGYAHAKEIDWNAPLGSFYGTGGQADESMKQSVAQMFAALYQPAKTYCDQKMGGTAMYVHDWLQAGEPTPDLGIPTPQDPVVSCIVFRNQVAARINAKLMLPLILRWTDGCTAGKDGYTHYCQTELQRERCATAFRFADLMQDRCVPANPIVGSGGGGGPIDPACPLNPPPGYKPPKKCQAPNGPGRPDPRR